VHGGPSSHVGLAERAPWGFLQRLGQSGEVARLLVAGCPVARLVGSLAAAGAPAMAREARSVRWKTADGVHRCIAELFRLWSAGLWLR
jgi:hypothetical protein